MQFQKNIYYASVLSGGTEDASKGTEKRLSTVRIFICAFLTAFGGDIFILHAYPAAFTVKCLPEIITVFVSTLLYLKMIKGRKRLQWFSVIADSMGLSQRIAIDAEKARNNFAAAILSSMTTALGGGIISSLLCGESIKKTLRSNLFYYISTVAGTIFYLVLIKYPDVDQTDAQGILMFYTLFFTGVSNSDVREAVKMYFTGTVRIMRRCKAFGVPSDYTAVIFMRDLRSEWLFYKLHKNTSAPPKRPPAPKRNAAILFHRIRQM